MVRQAVAPQLQAHARPISLPAPVRGWIESENLLGNKGGGAVVLENGFPTRQTVRVRGGRLKVSTVGDNPVTSLMSYQAGSNQKLLAATETSLFDVTSLNVDAPIDAAIQVGAFQENAFQAVSFIADPPSLLTNLVGDGRWSYAQMDTGGGQYLVGVNGDDYGFIYDGTDIQPLGAANINDLDFDHQTQEFVVGRTLTGGTSGATATIAGVTKTTGTSGTLKIYTITGTFQNNETLTGSSSGGSAQEDGTVTEVSTIKITGVLSSALSHVWVHNKRLWFVEQGKQKAWYLDTDSVGGTAHGFALGGEFQLGGSLLTGGTWSSDSGTGFLDRNVFISDQGEIIVYQGTDPSDADSWSKVGRYITAVPVGKQLMRAGGDLLIPTTAGIIPMSRIASQDPAAIDTIAVTKNIEPAWRRSVDSNSTSEPVQILKWSRRAMGLVSFPHIAEGLIVNLETGAWAKWTNHDIQCMALYNDWAYIGSSDGKIYQLDAIGMDDEETYTFRCGYEPNDLKAPGYFKTLTMARATFRALRPFTAKLSVAKNYDIDFPTAPNAALDPTESEALWDVGLWDAARWDDADSSSIRRTVQTQWRSIGVAGFSHSPQVQVTCGSTRRPDAELVSFDALYTTGLIVV